MEPLDFGAPGTTLPNGAVVVKQIGRGVLCVIPGNSATPWCYWTSFRGEDGDAGGGHYFFTWGDVLSFVDSEVMS